MSNIQTLRAEYIEKIKSVKSKQDLDSIKTELFGKSGKITSLFKNIGKLEDEKKKNLPRILTLRKRNCY
tara:strand:- start:99 stop:305 length:207 start_codon:yes stop_codon:yes gene_type:complete